MGIFFVICFYLVLSLPSFSGFLPFHPYKYLFELPVIFKTNVCEILALFINVHVVGVVGLEDGSNPNIWRTEN